MMSKVVKKNYSKRKVKNLKQVEQRAILLNPDTVPSAYDMQRVIEFNEALKELTVNRANFVKHFLSDEYFGNATRAYIAAAYPDEVDTLKTDDDRYAIASSQGWVVLEDQKVQRAVQKGLELTGLNNATVDSQLLYLIRQYKDNAAKIQAIKEYNKLNARIIDRQQVHQVTETRQQFNLDALDDEELGTFLTLLDKVTEQPKKKDNRENLGDYLKKPK